MVLEIVSVLFVQVLRYRLSSLWFLPPLQYNGGEWKLVCVALSFTKTLFIYKNKKHHMFPKTASLLLWMIHRIQFSQGLFPVKTVHSEVCGLLRVLHFYVNAKNEIPFISVLFLFFWVKAEFAELDISKPGQIKPKLLAFKKIIWLNWVFKGPENLFSQSASCYERWDPTCTHTFLPKLEQFWVLYRRDFFIFVFVFAFLTCLKGVRLSWEKVMSHTSVHQSEFRNILIKICFFSQSLIVAYLITNI